MLPLLLLIQNPDPQAVLDAAQAKLKSAQSVSGSLDFPTAANVATLQMSFDFAKPNRFVTVLGTRETRCDGVNQYILNGETKEFDLYPVVPNTMPRFAWGFDSFFALPEGSFSLDHPVAATFAGKTAVVAEFHSLGLRTTAHVAFDPETNLPLGFTLGEAENARDFTYRDIRLDVPEPKAKFSWAPSGKWHKREPLAEHMLKVGSKAPDFTITTPTGARVSLTQALKGKKGLLLNFWFVNCNPCRQEFPHLQEMFPGLRDQGFAYLSVNQGDSSDVVTKFFKEAGYTFPVALNGKEKADAVTLYGVPAFPTNYVIAPDRTIVDRFVGFNEDGLKASIRKLGLNLR